MKYEIYTANKNIKYILHTWSIKYCIWNTCVQYYRFFKTAWSHIFQMKWEANSVFYSIQLGTWQMTSKKTHFNKQHYHLPCLCPSVMAVYLHTQFFTICITKDPACCTSHNNQAHYLSIVSFETVNNMKLLLDDSFLKL